MYCNSEGNSSIVLAEICEVTDFIAKTISAFNAAGGENTVPLPLDVLLTDVLLVDTVCELIIVSVNFLTIKDEIE